MSAKDTSAIMSWAWVVGLPLLLVIPFVAQPIHLDDGIYVDIGRNVLKTPWHAQDFPYCQEGDCVPDMGSHSHPPFLGYWIGFLIWLFGDGPRLNTTLHLGFLIFPMLFAAGMYRLALRFTSIPGLAAAVAIASPAAVVMSHNLMPDYPTLALWTIGLALYVDGVDAGRPGTVWASGVFLTLAAFCSYPALIAAGLCWVYAWLKRPRMRAAYWSPLLAVLWMAGWLTYSSIYFGRFVLDATAQYFLQTKQSLSTGSIADKLLSFPIMLAGTLIFPLPLIRIAIGWFNGRVAILWAIISVALAQLFAASYALPERFLVAVFIAAGGWVILGLSVRVRRFYAQAESPALREDLVFLAVWFAAATGALMFVYSYASARYLLPLLPPVVLLAFFRFADENEVRVRRFAIVGFLAAVVVALPLSGADFEMARIHREIARDFAESLKNWEKQSRFTGEWGFRYYMLEEGFRQFVSTSDDLSGGEWVIIPRQAVASTVPEDAQSMLVPVKSKSWRSSIPIRLMNQESHAGFYSSGWGLLPFSFSRGPVEEIAVYQISYLAERLPEISLTDAAKDETTLLHPAPGDGVDLIVPVPGKLSIPYDGPLPMRVQFTCVWDKSGCPIKVYYRRDGFQSEVPLERESSTAAASGGIPLHFDIRDSIPGTIVLEMKGPAGTAEMNRASIRNWLLLPSRGLP